MGTPFGEPPFCEPSAAVPAPWDDSLVLVLDNEVDDSLFAFSMVDGLLQGPRRLPLPANVGPADIESMASTGDILVVVGSHSRNKRCESRPKRQRVLVARWIAEDRRLQVVRTFNNAARAWPAVVRSAESCLNILFAKPAPALAKEVCQAIVAAEAAAEKRTSNCLTFNIEGAVAIRDPAPASASRVWLGLRAPLVDRAAVLLRLTPQLDALKFDGVALVDLDGRGVRELALDGEDLWGIAGPDRDGPGAFQLWRSPASSLAPGSVVSPHILPARLPNQAEGMVFAPGGVIIVIDGDRGEKSAPGCVVPARQAFIPLS